MQRAPVPLPQQQEDTHTAADAEEEAAVGSAAAVEGNVPVEKVHRKAAAPDSHKGKEHPPQERRTERWVHQQEWARSLERQLQSQEKEPEQQHRKDRAERRMPEMGRAYHPRSSRPNCPCWRKGRRPQEQQQRGQGRRRGNQQHLPKQH